MLSAALALMTAALVLISRAFPAFADGFFTFSKTVNALYALVWSPVPFSAGELFLYAAVVLALRRGGVWVYKIITLPDKRREALDGVSSLLLFVCAASFLFTALWGASYNARPLSERIGLPTRPRPAEDIEALAAVLLSEANRYAPLASRNGEGVADGGGFFGLRGGAPPAFYALGERIPLLAAPFYAPVKRVTAWPLMSYGGISGMYFPFTAEANVNPDTPDTHLPFTMCHEIAHRIGVCREDEANFVAFLACISSGDALFNYSAYLLAYIYASNALYAADTDAAYRVARLQSELVSFDLARYDEHLSKYEGAVKEAGTAINNTYLQAMGQPDGVRSYGRMVDLLCVWYADMLPSGGF